MKRVLLVATLLLPPLANAAEVYHATVTSTGASVASGQIDTGQNVVIQCDANAYFAWGKSTVTVASTTGVYLAANQAYATKAGFTNTYIAVISAVGTANCRVFYVY